MKKLLIDLDGTMYHGTRMIEGGNEFLKKLDEKGIEYLFLTNNASRTPKQAAEHMNKMGYHGIKPEMFYTSAMASVDEVKRISDRRRVFMIGEEGLKQALCEAGFQLVEEDADFVFVGLDRQADYRRYSLALRQLKKGAVLVGTNDDLILLSEEGVNVGNGTIVRMLETCSAQSSLKIGKPSSIILKSALKAAGWKKDEVIIVGDNLETDILCGILGGVQSALVLTGISTKEDCDRLNIYPDIIVHELSELLDYL